MKAMSDDEEIYQRDWAGALGKVVMECYGFASEQGRGDKLLPKTLDIPDDYLRSQGWERAARIIRDSWWKEGQFLEGQRAYDFLVGLRDKLVAISTEWGSYQDYIKRYGGFNAKRYWNHSSSPMPHFHLAPYAVMLAASMIHNRVLRIVCKHEMVFKSCGNGYDEPIETFWECRKCNMMQDTGPDEYKIPNAIYLDDSDAVCKSEER